MLFEKEYTCINPGCPFFEDPVRYPGSESKIPCCPHCTGALQTRQVSANYQFFTTDSDEKQSWFPMDHFFFGAETPASDAGSMHPKKNDGKKEVIVHLEGHTSFRSPTGFSVSIGYTNSLGIKVGEEWPDYPSALRRMADIIEQFERTLVK